MISAVYLINAKGDIILYRKYRDDVARYVRSPFPFLSFTATPASHCPLPCPAPWS